MRHYSAQQRKSDSRWDYTISYSDGLCYPTGYCCEFRDPDEISKTIGHDCFSESQKAEMRGRKDKYHTSGHATKEEAEKCYRDYVLDTSARFHCEDKDTQRKCEKCGTWTTKMVLIDMHTIQLCDEHQTREIVEELYPSIGTSWVS